MLHRGEREKKREWKGRLQIGKEKERKGGRFIKGGKGNWIIEKVRERKERGCRNRERKEEEREQERKEGKMVHRGKRERKGIVRGEIRRKEEGGRREIGKERKYGERMEEEKED